MIPWANIGRQETLDGARPNKGPIPDWADSMAALSRATYKIKYSQILGQSGS
jgi:hypothetical protein